MSNANPMAAMAQMSHLTGVMPSYATADRASGRDGSAYSDELRGVSGVSAMGFPGAVPRPGGRRGTTDRGPPPGLHRLSRAADFRQSPARVPAAGNVGRRVLAGGAKNCLPPLYA